MKFLNLYFFGEEEVSKHDFIWFYGFYALVAFLLITLITIVL